MILVGNQRGGAKDLALHLLKEDNDHVRVHELRGFASDNLASALNESYAVSRGTRCKQFLFSLSLNPPPSEQVSTEDFERTIDRAEAELGLTGQPRAVVFHEKEGPGGVRRHAHAVWSRIDTDEMKAIQLSHTKRKLTALSRELFIEHPQWRMPDGLMVSGTRDMRNFSHEEWQQAKRAGVDRCEIKAAIQDCWAVSDSRAAFEQALESRGYKLARGDRRGFVAVDMNGEPYAISRWTGLKVRDVRARLGELDEKYPGVGDRHQEFAAQISTRLKELRETEERRQAEERAQVEAERKVLVERQRREREMQDAALRARWERETAERQDRFNRGLRGLLDRITGRFSKLRDQNFGEAHAAMVRDRSERDRLVFQHMSERREFGQQQRKADQVVEQRKQELDADIRRYEPQRSEAPPAAPARSDSGDSARSPPEHGPARSATPSPAPPASHDPDREARKAEFIRERQEQARSRPRSRGPMLDR